MGDLIPSRPDESRLEQALGVLRPAASTINRDRLMFEAGRVSGRRSARAWQALCGVLVVALGLALAFRTGRIGTTGPVRQPRGELRVVPGSRESLVVRDTTGSARLHGSSYGRLRDAVLTGGLQELPEPSSEVNPESQPPSWRARLDALSSS